MPVNEKWARRIIQIFDPGFQTCWEVFNILVQSHQHSTKICLDIGSGSKGSLESFYNFKLKIHSDLMIAEQSVIPGIHFMQMNIYHLPLKSNSIDLILLRFVVEHLADPAAALREIQRVLHPQGIVIILTTNFISPLIWLPKLLPYSWRKKSLQKLFKISEQDVFPTYHRLNRKKSVIKSTKGFEIDQWHYLQDTNWQRKWVFLFLFGWHLLTKLLRVKFLRSNFIVVLRKII